MDAAAINAEPLAGGLSQAEVNGLPAHAFQVES
jgi:hypothetical protein